MKYIIYVCLIFINIYGVKLEEVANFVGIRDNHLIGYGIVVGLSNSGDKASLVTKRSLSNYLNRNNIKIDAGSLSSGNIASVMVTSTLPPFAKQGDKIDISISSIGDAKSIKGGTLLLTPLKAVNGKIYALAQGAISIPTTTSSKSHLTAGSVLSGATVELEIKNELSNKKRITISLKESNFINAINVETAINKAFKNSATAFDGKTIVAKKPLNMSMVAFLAKLEMIDIRYVKKDKIIIDEKTGTIIAGVSVRVEPVMITHGDLIVTISHQVIPISIEDDIGGGISVDIENGTISTEKKRPTIANIARALQKMGAKPKDIVSIITAMKKAGAISVDIEVL